MKHTPLICTNNTLGNIDYGIPILAQNADFRTSSHHYHRFIPPITQHFDCRVKVHIEPFMLKQNVAVKDESYKSDYNGNFTFKRSSQTPDEKCFKAARCNNVENIQHLDDKIFKQPPASTNPLLSEMKDGFQYRSSKINPRKVFPPSESNRCDLYTIGREFQPSIRPEDSCYWKHLDIYYSEYRDKFKQYSPEDHKKAQDNILTFYNIYTNYKPYSGPLPNASGNKAIYDSMMIKYEELPRKKPKTLARVPNFGLTSEYKGNYNHQSYSDLYPYLNATGVKCPGGLTFSSPWQNLAAPAMYCTENCHIGSGWPVEAVINTNLDKRIIERTPNCPKY